MIKLKCLKEDFEGNGIVLYNNEEKKIPFLLEGEIGVFETEKKGKYTNLILKGIENESKNRIKSLCPVYGQCGGCQYMHMSYDHEIEVKNSYIKYLFNKSYNVRIDNIISMKDPYNYRDKCQMSFKLSKSHKVVCGFYEESSHKIVPISNCMIQDERASKIIDGINNSLTRNKILPYDEKIRAGIIRHVVIRLAKNTNEIMVSLVTNGEMFPGRKNFITDLLKQNLGITTIVQNYNSRDTSIVMGERERVLYGPGFIYDIINGIKFKISSRSFYQVNPIGMKNLYEKIIEEAKITKNDIVIDAYSGVGTIGILVAKYAKEVISVELNKDASKDAIINAKLNGIKNIKFFNDDSTRFIKELAREHKNIDVLIMDPPREGSTKDFINTVALLKPKKVIYVSCEPKTLVRDLYDFTKNDYLIKSISPVDMFPRTFNVETVCCLVKQK